ncbi:MAG: glycosyltransferase family 2 protein [Stenomitos frigidus ULC029]
MSQLATNQLQTGNRPLVSILINNYNYDRFLKAAIDSALSQTYTNIEVVVVDDGSTDQSQAIITSYGKQIVPVLKSNGGQASAFNAGFEQSNGEFLFFLDADDTFAPHKVETIVNFLTQLIPHNPNLLLFNALTAIDEKGLPLKVDSLGDSCEWRDLHGNRELPTFLHGALTRISTSVAVYKHAAKYRYIPYLASPTSGFALTRALAEQVFPLPCQDVKTSADDFLIKAASLLGEIYQTDHVLTQYRIHGKNNWYGQKKPVQKSFLEALDAFLNSKLESSARKPVFSYFDSIHAQVYYRTHYASPHQYTNELLRTAIKTILWHLDLRTTRFFVKAIVLALYSKLNLSNPLAS